MLSAFRPQRSRARLSACALLLLLFLSLAAALGTRAAERPVDLDVRPAPLAENLKPGDSVGAVRFLGMVMIPSTTVDGARLSQLSDIAWDEDADVLYAISDKGILFHLRPVIHDDLLTGVELLRVARLQELKGGKPLRDRRADAEGLDIVRGENGRPKDAELIVSFERHPRIWRYRPDGRALGEYALPEPLTDPAAYVQGNRMLEAVCHDASRGVLTMPEKPLEQEPSGYSRIYSTAGTSWRYRISDDNRAVALACLGDGDVLILENNFGTRFWRSHTTLKRVRLPKVSTAAALEAETLFSFESNKGYQIDNFEGIARHRGNRFFLISDDNDFFLQRTLLLYFEILSN